MARNKRIRPERQSNKIEIERNVIEQFLMDVRDIVKNNRKFVLYILAGFLCAVVVAIAAVIAVDQINTKNQKRFEKIMDDYSKYMSQKDMEKVKENPKNKENEKDDEKDKENKKVDVKVLISDLKKFEDSTYFGFSHSYSNYILGNIYYKQKDYTKARTYLLKFADKEPKIVLAPIALLKAVVAAEELHDLKGALETCKLLEDKYANGIMADQIFYNTARIYAEKKDLVNARMYYNKVITAFPESSFTQESKKRLFMLGVK